MDIPTEPGLGLFSLWTLSIAFLVIHSLISAAVGLVFKFAFKFPSAIKMSLYVALINTMAYFLFSLPPKFGFYWSPQNALAGVLATTAVLALIAALISIKAIKRFTTTSTKMAFALWAANTGVLVGFFGFLLSGTS